MDRWSQSLSEDMSGRWIAAKRRAHIDRLHYVAYESTEVSVHVRLTARDMLRQIKEGVYTWPTYLT